MPAAVQLSTMRSAARQRAGMENSTFVADSEVNGYVNYGLLKVYNALCDADVEQFRSTFQFTTVPGTSLYGLPTAIYRLRSVDVSNGNDIVTARKYMEHERNLYKNYPYWATGWPVRYRELGANINFIPTPSSTYSVTLNFYPTFTLLGLDTDTFDGVNGYEEYAIWSAVAAMLAKEESDNSFAMARMEEILADIKQQAGLRDMGEPERAVDVYAVTSGWRR